MNKVLARRLRFVTRKLTPQSGARLVAHLESRMRDCLTVSDIQAEARELLAEMRLSGEGRGLSPAEIAKDLKFFAHLITVWGMAVLEIRFNSVRPVILLFLLWLASTLDENLIPTHRIEVLRPLGGRAPPPVAIFVPIPKLEMGSCARSDLADSAYLI